MEAISYQKRVYSALSYFKEKRYINIYYYYYQKNTFTIEKTFRGKNR